MLGIHGLGRGSELLGPSPAVGDPEGSGLGLECVPCPQHISLHTGIALFGWGSTGHSSAPPPRVSVTSSRVGQDGLFHSWELIGFTQAKPHESLKPVPCVTVCIAALNRYQGVGT